MGQVRHVVSVSLGSSAGDKRIETEVLGQRFIIERIGTNGDYQLFCRRLREFDGRVDAIGIGGINLALVAGRRKYYIRDAVRAIAGLKTPVVDGSGIKQSWERHIILTVLPERGLALRGRRVLLVASVDRFSMAEAFTEAGADVLFGDLMFGLGVPIGLRGLTTIKVLAALLLPLFTRLPFTWLYPTGERQDTITPKFGGAYRWAEVIAGDFHYIKRHLPDDLAGKVIFTNTMTPADVELLRQRKAALLITATPEMDGRSFGTNVLEAVVVTLSGRRPQELTPGDYLEWMRRAGFQPRVQRLTPSA
ncbi:MAG: quinate 5-dehydrogenase [Armatimonadota bacterium]|nr:quinate 5-dehydrogenase [Armatimonadota bacterium]